MTSPESETRASSFAAFRHRNYRWYYLSGMGMTASQFIQQLTLSWLVLDLTGSVGALGFVIFMQGLPMAAISLFGGVLADRYNRRLLLMAAQTVTLANMLILSTLTITGIVEVWQVVLSASLLGTAQAVTMPSRNAIVSALCHARICSTQSPSTRCNSRPRASFGRPSLACSSALSASGRRS